MSFVDDLLDGNFDAETPQPRRALESSRSPRVPSRRVDLSETCAGLVSQLSGAIDLSESRSRGVVTISADLAKQIVRALKEAESDPFSRGGSGSIDTGDLERLGVQVVNKPSSGRGDDPFSSDDDDDEAHHSLGFGNTEDPIPPSAAVVAPSATPGGDSKIPDEVLRTMEILMSSEEEVPLNPAEQSPNTPLRNMFGGSGTEGGAPSAPEDEGEGGQEQEQEGDGESPAEMAQRIRKTLANSRRNSAMMTESNPDPNQHEIVSIKRRMSGRKSSPMQENSAAEAKFLAKISGLGR